jgi:hypothetical protein
MLTECDALTRYNNDWDDRRQEGTTPPPEDNHNEITTAPSIMNVPVHFIGPTDQNKCESRSPLAKIWDTARQVLVINEIGCPISEALTMSNLNSFHGRGDSNASQPAQARARPCPPVTYAIGRRVHDNNVSDVSSNETKIRLDCCRLPADGTSQRMGQHTTDVMVQPDDRDGMDPMGLMPSQSNYVDRPNPHPRHISFGRGGP